MLPLLDNADVLLREIAAQLAELNGRSAVSVFQPSGSPLPERQGASAAVLRSIGTQELQSGPPTQEDVDAYVDLWTRSVGRKRAHATVPRGRAEGSGTHQSPTLKCLRFVLGARWRPPCVPTVAASNHLRLAEVKGDNVVLFLPVPSTAYTFEMGPITRMPL